VGERVHSDVNDMTLLKNEKLGTIELYWYKDNKNHFGVNIQSVTRPDETLKQWCFEKSPVSEAFSFYWYDYVFKMAEKYGVVPDQIVEMDSTDVEKMLVKILKNL
jgi:hypothetical protein